MRKLIVALLLCAASLISAAAATSRAPAAAAAPHHRIVVAHSERETVATGIMPFTRLFKQEQGAGRWNPCQTVFWKINADGYTPKRFKQTLQAFRQLRRATGLVIRYAGVITAEEIAAGENGVITVSYLPASEFDPDVLGTAGVAIAPSGDGGAITSADVRIAVHTSFDRRHGYLPVLLHELGHAVGLGHSGDRRSLMYPTLTRVRTYNAGDLAGLASVGASHGCVAPPVSPTETAAPAPGTPTEP